MAQQIRIDFVSDIACPWCVIGLGGLLSALVKLRDEIRVDLRFQPFELNPDMPVEGENLREHVSRKYGSTAEHSDKVREIIREHGAAYGFTFNYSPESRIWNTFDAHRLLHWSHSAG